MSQVTKIQIKARNIYSHDNKLKSLIKLWIFPMLIKQFVEIQQVFPSLSHHILLAKRK